MKQEKLKRFGLQWKEKACAASSSADGANSQLQDHIDKLNRVEIHEECDELDEAFILSDVEKVDLPQQTPQTPGENAGTPEMHKNVLLDDNINECMFDGGSHETFDSERGRTFRLLSSLGVMFVCL